MARGIESEGRAVMKKKDVGMEAGGVRSKDDEEEIGVGVVKSKG